MGNGGAENPAGNSKIAKTPFYILLRLGTWSGGLRERSLFTAGGGAVQI